MRFRSGEAAVMSHVLLHCLCPSDKPLCTDRYVNDQAICTLTSSWRGCVCTMHPTKIYQLDACPPLYKHMNWQQRGIPQGLRQCLWEYIPSANGYELHDTTSFHRVPSDFSLSLYLTRVLTKGNQRSKHFLAGHTQTLRLRPDTPAITHHFYEWTIVSPV